MRTVEWCDWKSISWVPERFEHGDCDFASRSKPEIWFKATEGDELLGIGCLLILSARKARISNGFVLPAHRGKGIIQEIIRARESWAKQHGFLRVDVHTKKKYFDTEAGYRVIKKFKNGFTRYAKDLA